MAGFGYYKNLDDFMEANGYVIHGQWYPRVTSIVSIKAKPALLKYYADAASYSSALSMTKQSATEGTKVHNAVETLLTGGVPEVDKEVQPAVDAFVDFRMNHDLKVDKEAIEKRIFSPANWYAGTIDALAELDGKFGILDIKTSSGIWRDYNLQTAAYMSALAEPEAWGELKLRPIESRWILRLDQAAICQFCGAKKRTKGGRVAVRGGADSCEHKWSAPQGEWELKELDGFQNDLKAFLGAKALWEWENENWLGQINR